MSSVRMARLELLAFGLLFGTISFLPIRERFIYLATGNWTFLVVTVVAFVALLLIRGSRRGFNRSDWPLWLFALALAAGLVNSVDPSHALRVFWHMAVILVAFYFAGKISISEPGLRRGVCVTIASLSAVVGLYGLVESAFGGNPLYEGLWSNPYYERYLLQNRPVSTQFNPAPLGSLLLLSWPFAAVLIRAENRWLRGLGFASVVLSVSCLFLAFSRVALLGLIVMVVLALALRKRFKEVVLGFVVLALMIGVATFLPYPVSKFGVHGFFGASGGVFSPGHLAKVRMTFRMMQQHPWVGMGHGGFEEHFAEFDVQNRPLPSFTKTDNSYLTLAAETGLVGALAFVVFCALLLRGAVSAYRSARGTDRAVAEAVLLALVGLLFNAAGYNLFSWTAPWMYSCLVFGFAAGLESVVDDRHRLPALEVA